MPESDTTRSDRDYVALYDQYAEWLSPVQREDFRAVVIEGQSRARRAQERGVASDTISQNISNAKARLEEATEREGENYG